MECWRGGGGRGRMAGLIDYLRHPGPGTTAHPSCSLFTPRPPSIADPPNKGDQIGHFHLNELSPNKRQRSGDRLHTPKYPRDHSCKWAHKRAGRGKRETPKMYLYMVKKMLIRCWKNGGDLGDCLILPLLNSRADGRD